MLSKPIPNRACSHFNTFDINCPFTLLCIHANETCSNLSENPASTFRMEYHKVNEDTHFKIGSDSICYTNAICISATVAALLRCNRLLIVGV